MERAGLERIMVGNCHMMNGWARVAQPNMAAPSANHRISELFQRSDKATGRDAARRPHAASSGINSSLT